MVRVTAKFFGPLKELVQCDEMMVDVPAPGRGEDAFEQLAQQHPALRPWKASLRLAVNLEYTTFNHVLRSGDEISFIPPVSGG
jgi:molybdopterin converting factor subunit 1